MSVVYGIAAFPSMHVAFQTFVFLWMRRLWIYGQLVFGVFLLMTYPSLHTFVGTSAPHADQTQAFLAPLKAALKCVFQTVSQG